MSTDKKRRLIAGAALLTVAALGLHSWAAAASKSFTLAMEDSARAKWDASFSKIVAQPFSTIECASGKKNELAAGSGCVDAGDSQICCSAWTLIVQCTDEHKWQQTAIEGSGCERKPTPSKE
jgi:hypothetical protein